MKKFKTNISKPSLMTNQHHFQRVHTNFKRITCDGVGCQPESRLPVQAIGPGPPARASEHVSKRTIKQLSKPDEQKNMSVKIIE